MTTFNAREFMYPRCLAAFVHAGGGAVVTVSICPTPNNTLILFSQDEDGVEEKLMRNYRYRGPGRGWELLTDEELKREEQGVADAAVAAEAAVAVVAAAQANRDLEAAIRAEVDAEVRKRMGG